MDDFDSDNEYYSDDENEQFNTCDDDEKQEERQDDIHRGDWYRRDRYDPSRFVDLIDERIAYYLDPYDEECAGSRQEQGEAFRRACVDAYNTRNQWITYKKKRTRLGYQILLKIMYAYYRQSPIIAFAVVNHGLFGKWVNNERQGEQFDKFSDSVRKSFAHQVMREGSCDKNDRREEEAADAAIIRKYNDEILRGKRGLYHYEYQGDDGKTHFRYFTLPVGRLHRFMEIIPENMRQVHQKVLNVSGYHITRFDIERVFTSVEQGRIARDILEKNLLRLCVQAINDVCHHDIHRKFKFCINNQDVHSLAELLEYVNNMNPHDRDIRNFPGSCIVFAQCHRKEKLGYKISFHVHFPKLVMPDKMLVAVCLQLSKLIRNLLDIEDNIVDTCIYGHKKSLRCVLSHKTGYPEFVMRPYRDNTLNMFELTYDQTGYASEYERLKIKVYHDGRYGSIETNYPELFGEYGADDEQYENSFSVPSDLDAFSVALDGFLKDRPYLYTDYTIKQNHIHIARKECAHCNDCDRVHENRGAIVKQRRDGYYAICEAAYYGKTGKIWHLLDIAAPVRDVVADNTIRFGVNGVDQYVKAYIAKYPGQYCENIVATSEKNARCNAVVNVACHKCNIVHLKGCYVSISFDAKSLSVFVRRVAPCDTKPKAEYLCSVDANRNACVKKKEGWDLERAVTEIVESNRDNNLFQLNPRDHAGFITIKRNEQYISSIPSNARMMVIKSPKGTGKSHAMVRLFKELCEKDDMFRILVITHRVSFGLSLRADIEREGIACSFYQDSSEEHLTLKQGLNIVQIDSLRRIRCDLGSCSMVVLDEIQSIISKVKDFDDVRRSQSLHALKAALTETERVLIMDANITDQLMKHVINPAALAQDRHLTEHRKQEVNVRVRLLSELMEEIGAKDIKELNRLQKEQKKLINSVDDITEPYLMVNEYLPLKEAKYRADITNNLGRLYRLIFKDLDDKKRVAVASSSKNKLIRLESVIKEKYPTLKVLLISGDMPDHEKRLIFANVDATFSKYDVLLYSPSVSSGISFSRAHFARLYVIYTKGGMNTLDCSQQMHRIRHLAEKHLVIYLNVANASDKGGIPSVRELEARHLSDIRTKVGIDQESTFITRVHAYNEYIHTISNRRVLECIVHLLLNDGIEVDVVDDINNEDNQMTKLAKAKKGEQLAKHLAELNKATRFVEMQYVDALKNTKASKMKRTKTLEEIAKKLDDARASFEKSDDEDMRKIIDDRIRHLEALESNEMTQGREDDRKERMAIQNYAIRSHINADCDISVIDEHIYRLYENPLINKAVTAYRWYRGMKLDDIRVYDFARSIGNSRDFDACGHLEYPINDNGVVWTGYEHYKQRHYANKDEYVKAWKRFHMMKRASRSYGKLIDVENADACRFTAKRIHVAGCLLRLLGFEGDHVAVRKVIDFDSHASEIARLVEEFNQHASKLDQIPEDIPSELPRDKNRRRVNNILMKCFNIRLTHYDATHWLEWVASDKDELIFNIDTLEFVKVGQVASNETKKVYTQREEAAAIKDEFGDKSYIAVPNGEGFFYIKSKNAKKGKKAGEMKLSSVTTHKNKYPELRDLYEHKTKVEKLIYKNTE